MPAPRDWESPRWIEAGKVHEWKNHVPGMVRTIWHTFSISQKMVLAEAYNELASNEEWE